jgi:Pyruvate/2-oxoglutarate dehydrogenase complex, dihydrolipoamide dehydrogenase (E3) component, and related enzymes
MMDYDVVVIGGGPAGLAAAKTASDYSAKTLLIEREGALGGILKQCIHDGFGVTRFNEKLSGPEYAYREIEKLKTSKVEVLLLSFVTRLKKIDAGYQITLVNPQGVKTLTTRKLILATGCRERTSKQVMIQGTNPAGVMTAGQAQYYINIMGKMPIKECVILGSGDIGLIMARRITLEGGHVEGVYEAKSTPSGLARNIAQCLTDFNIPLHLSETVTRVYGVDRLEGVEIAKVDEHMAPIPGTERKIPCDSLILSVGLIPENELAKSLDVPLSGATKGPEVDQTFMSRVEGVYSCGNAMHVNDLADYVSESGEIAGKAAATSQNVEHHNVKVEVDPQLLYVVPEVVDFAKPTQDMVFYFRAKNIYQNKVLHVFCGDNEILKRTYTTLKPPEMERLKFSLDKEGAIRFVLGDK